MRHEVIKLTDEGLCEKLANFINKEGFNVNPAYLRLLIGINIHFDQISGWETCSHEASITDTDFLQKYGNTDQPDKERELLEKYESFRDPFVPRISNIDKFLTSIRTPAFSLQCCDEVVTDPEQIVWYVSNGVFGVLAKDAHLNDDQYFSARESAESHRLHNTPAIKLNDMEIGKQGCYWIEKDKAHNLVNERINNK
jgi:hypothetical protein